MVENWKETPSMEEERTFKKLKECVMKERIVEILGKKRNPENREENDSEELSEKRKQEDIRKTASTTPRKTTWKKMTTTRREPGGNSPVAKSFVRNFDSKQKLSVKHLAE